MSGNKTDNGVLEVGSDEIRVSYSEDTPGQYVDEFIKEQEKAFHEQKKKTKRHFSQVFQNPLKGFPYNEEITVTEKPLQEGTMTVPKTTQQQKALKKLLQKPLKAKDAQQAISPYVDDDGLADDIAALPANADARDVITKWLIKYGPNKQKSWGSMVFDRPSKFLQQIAKNHQKHLSKALTRKGLRSEVEVDEAFSKKPAKGKDIAKKMMKSKTMKGFANKVKNMKTVTAVQLDKMLPDYVSGGDIGALFEGNSILKQDIKGLNHISDIEIRFSDEKEWKRMSAFVKRELKKPAYRGIKSKDVYFIDDPLQIGFGDPKGNSKINIKPIVDIVVQQTKDPKTRLKSLSEEEDMQEAKSLKQLKSKYKKAVRNYNNNRDIGDEAAMAFAYWAIKNGEIKTDDPDEFDQWLDDNLSEEAVIVKEITTFDGRKPSFEEFQEASSRMSGSKLTGQEISSYFRKHKVRDKTVRKAVEIALDHGGAMNFAIKQIEKLKRGLSKHKDVKKALDVANFGEHVSEQDVEKFFGFFTEGKGGKYLKYSDLLLRKGQLMAKGRDTKTLDREIDKEMKRLGIQDQVEEDKLTEASAFETMQDIVKNKQAQKIKGTMVDMFTASVVVKAYDKVNDANKKKIEKANLDTLVKLAHKVMGMKEEVELEEAPVMPSTQAGEINQDHSIEDGVKKYEDAINKHYKTGRFAKLHKERQSKVVARKANKYYRVEEWEMGKAGSIHAFIEISTGDIFKPASWKAPAKGARGNVTDQRYIDYVAKYPDAYYGGHLYK